MIYVWIDIISIIWSHINLEHFMSEYNMKCIIEF